MTKQEIPQYHCNFSVYQVRMADLVNNCTVLSWRELAWGHGIYSRIVCKLRLMLMSCEMICEILSNVASRKWSISFTNTLPTIAGSSHQWTESTNIGHSLGRPAPTLVPCWSLNPCLQGTSVGVGLPQPIGHNQWLSLVKITLKVPPVDRNRSMVANTNMCGEGITSCNLRLRKYITSWHSLPATRDTPCAAILVCM
jgi:hypothetical protein